MNLHHRDSPFEIKSLSSSGMFSGYGSVYDVPDQCDDVVAGGAFAESLTAWNEKGSMPAMLWQHRADQPIGVYTRMSEDTKGLFVEGQLIMGVPEADKAYKLLKAKAISGLSIGYMTRDDSIDRVTGIRTIKKADLWEVSLVTFPMNDAARVDQVKAINQIQTVSDLERFLREVERPSKSEAKAIANRLMTLARREVANGSPGGAQAVLDALKRRAEALTA